MRTLSIRSNLAASWRASREFGQRGHAYRRANVSATGFVGRGEGTDYETRSRGSDLLSREPLMSRRDSITRGVPESLRLRCRLRG